MTLTSQTQGTEILPSVRPATEKQLTYIRNLLAKRDWQNGLSKEDAYVIETVRPSLTDESFTADKFSAKSASWMIDKLLSCRPIVSLSTAFVTIKEKSDLLKQIPLSKYALPRKNDMNTWDFFEVVERNGVRYLNRLFGAPGSWRREHMSVIHQAAAARAILQDPKASAVQYATQHGRCAVCESPLSDPESIARSMGPICAKRF